MGRSAPKSLSSLKNTGKEERHTTAVFVLRDPLVVS
jgi:hypothetical protein